MFERYALYQLQDLRDRFSLPDGVPSGVKLNYNISPTNLVPILIQRDGKRVMVKHSWGFVTQGAKDMNGVFRYKTYAAKSELAFDKVMWKHSMRSQRCIIPANGFYEWHKSDDGKQAYFIQFSGQPLVGVAGIYSSWTDPQGVEHGTFAALTTDTHSPILHAKVRRPIVIERADEQVWLDPNVTDANDIYGCMKPYTDDTLTITPVSDKVNSIKAKGEQLIAPLTA